MRDISKRFGNLEALSHVSFRLRPGTVHALLGENGAGKTTLMRIAFGMIKPDAGTICVYGIQKSIHSPAHAIAAGIGMVHQHFMLVPAMTVVENVELGGRGRYNSHDSANRLRLLQQQTGFALDPLATVNTLSVAAQQRLEIMKALAYDACILILDEPTAVLAPAEAVDLLARIRQLVSTGRSVVLITHKLRDAQRYADDVSVLRRGELTLTGAMPDFNENALARAMLGQSPDFIHKQQQQTLTSTGDIVLRLTNVSLVQPNGVHQLQNVNIEVGAGEIVGIAALEGTARQLLRIMSGRQKATKGLITLPSKIGFVPEDRQHDALVPAFSLFENVALKGIGKRKGRMPWSEIRNRTASLLADYDVRTDDIDLRARDLSGGNQQKLILARELSGNPGALIAENPTRGLDIQASAAIHERLRDAKQNGCAIVLYSSDIDELVSIADRVFVIRDRMLAPVAVDAAEIGNALLRSPGDSPPSTFER